MLEVGLILTDENLSDKLKVSKIKSKHLTVLRKFIEERGA